MNIYRNIEEIHKDKNTVLTLGTFDGVHLGHQVILNKVVELAKKNGGRSFVITFEPHPQTVLSNKKPIKILTNLHEKIYLFKQLGIENVLVINFTEDFAQIPSKDFFINYIVEKIGISECIVGHDHHFGKGRKGDESLIKELAKLYNFNVTHIDALKINDEIVSSTKIRKYILNGNLLRVNQFLGRKYAFSGKVVEGDKKGRDLGFPTANLEVDKDKLLPPLGVYPVEVCLDSDTFNSYKGMMYIGTRPTFKDSENVMVEVNIFDFKNDIYGKNLTINAYNRIRGDEKFTTAEDLIEKIQLDKEKSLEILNQQSIIPTNVGIDVPCKLDELNIG